MRFNVTMLDSEGAEYVWLCCTITPRTLAVSLPWRVKYAHRIVANGGRVYPLPTDGAVRLELFA